MKLVNLAELPKLGGRIVKTVDLIDKTPVDLLKSETRARFETIEWQVEMTALSAIIIDYIWKNIDWGKFQMEKLFKSDDFYLNFSESLLRFIREESKDVKSQVEQTQNDGSKISKIFRRYNSLFVEKYGDAAAEVLPDFGDFVMIGVYLGHLIEDKLSENSNIEKSSVEVERILNWKSILNFQKQIMFNKDVVASAFLSHLCEFTGRKFKVPIPGSVYLGPFSACYRFDPNKFDLNLDGEVFEVKEAVVKDFINQDLSSKFFLDSETDQVKGCPVLYKNNFDQMWGQFVHLFCQERFKNNLIEE